MRLGRFGTVFSSPLLPRSKRSFRTLLSSVTLFILLAAFLFHLSVTNSFGTPASFLKRKRYLPEYRVPLEPASADFIRAVESAKDASGVTIVLSASYGYLGNVMNSMCSLQRAGVKRALMVSLDRKMFEWAEGTGFFVPVMLPGADDAGDGELINYGSGGFEKVTMQKFMSVERVLAAGSVALFADGDIFWCRDPLPAILAAAAAAPDADLLFQTSFEYVRKGLPMGDYINTGLFLARPTRKAREFFLKAMKDWEEKPINNQRVVNNRLCKAELGGRVVYEQIGLGWLSSRRRPAYCTRDGLRAGFLSSKLFPNGPTRTRDVLTRPSRKKVRQRCDAGKYICHHNNYIEGIQKELRFKSQGLWYVEEGNTRCLDSPVARPMKALKECRGRACARWRKDRTK